MANEIKVTLRVDARNGNYRDEFNPGVIQIDQSTAFGSKVGVEVGTSEEDLSLGDVATPGVIAIRNLDATNYITFGPKSGGAMVALGKIEPGEVVLVRLASGVTLRWQANTAACKAQVLILAD